MNILIVRLGALGDVVHAIPAAAAIRASLPTARIDWLVESRHRPIVDLVTVVDRVVPLDGRPGLMKSAGFARASGALRVAGFSIWHLREKGARPFYSETSTAGGDAQHVIQKNLQLLRDVGIDASRVEFPLAPVQSPALDSVRAELGAAPFALINPGAAWPNKQWPPSRFGEVAVFLRDVRGLSSVVVWGPGDEAIASAVIAASQGAARQAPPTAIADLVALSRAAALIVSGDTGPLHIAAAVGTPAVAIFGPTDPARNGPWSPEDISLARYERCDCHYERTCHLASWCLDSITVAEVTAAIQPRLGRGPSPLHRAERDG
jgi:ADP-heptose:LPS heptosyltransferase